MLLLLLLLLLLLPLRVSHLVVPRQLNTGALVAGGVLHVGGLSWLTVRAVPGVGLPVGAPHEEPIGMGATAECDVVDDAHFVVRLAE